jgi:hypothetical protein
MNADTFHWRNYINQYIDLQNAGINTKELAIKHWIEYGLRENRIHNLAIGCDHVISLGGNYFPALLCTHNGLRDAFYPFDWTKTNLPGIVNCLVNKFESYFDNIKVNGLYSNPYLLFEFPQYDMDNPERLKQLKHGIQRLYNVLDSDNAILFVYEGDQGDELMNFLSFIKKFKSQLNFKILWIKLCIIEPYNSDTATCIKSVISEYIIHYLVQVPSNCHQNLSNVVTSHQSLKRQINQDFCLNSNYPYTDTSFDYLLK